MTEPTPGKLLQEAISLGWFNATPTTSGDDTELAATRSGQLTVTEFIHLLGMIGACYTVNYGQGTTFVTAKTGLTAAQPDFNLDVPSGTAIVPLQLNLSFGAMTGTANHFFVQYGNTNTGAGTSSAATAGPRALGTFGRNSACTALQAYSGNGTAPGSPIELWSLDDPTAATGSVPLQFQWEPVTLFPLIGPACIAGYGASTTNALTFKAQLVWAEFPADLFI